MKRIHIIRVSLIGLFIIMTLTVFLQARPMQETQDLSGDSVQESSLDTRPDYRNPAELAALIQSGSPEHLLIDVRTPGEYSGGHIPTAINNPVSEIGANPPALPKEQLLIVYCRSGNRSGQAAGILRNLGYTNIVDFGGIYRWEGELE